MSTPAVNKAGCGHGGPRRARRGAHRGSITWKGCCKWQLLLVLLLLPPAHSTTTEGGYTEAHAKYRGLHVYRWPHNIYRELRVNMQIAPNSFPVSAANTAFLGTTSLAQQGKGPQKSTSNIMKNFSLAREVWAYPCSVTTLWGSRSNRINGKKPSVLPSPSPFPAALLHLLPGGSSLPNEVYIGQHVRLPVSPSSNLSLSRGPQGPPRLFAPAPLLLDIRASLQKQGLPVTRLRWPQDAALQQQQEQQKQEQKQEGVRAQNGEPLTFESLAVKGDKHPEKKMFGAEAPLFKHHLHFGAPPWPNAIIAMAKEYNRQAREAGKEADTVPEDWRCVRRLQPKATLFGCTRMNSVLLRRTLS